MRFLCNAFFLGVLFILGACAVSELDVVEKATRFYQTDSEDVNVFSELENGGVEGELQGKSLGENRGQPTLEVLEVRPSNQRAANRIKRMRSIEACWSDPYCAVEPTGNGLEPQWKTFFLRKQLTLELQAISSQLKGWSPEWVAEVARHYVRFDDDYIKEEAVNLYQHMEHSSENMQALFEGLQASSSIPLYESAFPVLIGYSEAGEQDAVAEFVQSQILHGGHFVSEYLAEKVSLWLSKETVGSFEQILKKIPVFTRRHVLLRFHIEQYHRARRMDLAVTD